MRIAMVSPRFPPYVGGVESHVSLLATFLAEQGHDVVSISTDPQHIGSASEERNKVQIKRVPAFAPKEIGFIARGLRRALKDARPDVVHAHNYRAFPMLQAAIGKSSEVPLVLTLHLGFSKVGSWAYVPYNATAGNYLFRAAKKIILVSETEREEVKALERWREKTILIPNGVKIDPSITSRSIHARAELPTLRILFVGRLEEKKGLPQLLDAMAALPSGFELDIVGLGPLEPKVRTIAAQDPRVRYHGRVTDDVLQDLYRRAQVFVLVSEFEAHSMSLTEAMAAGLACVIAPVGGNRGVAGDSARYLPYPCVPSALAAEIAQLSRDRAELARLGTQARARAVEQFSLVDNLARTERILKEVVS